MVKGEAAGIFYTAGGDGWLVRWDAAQPDMGHLAVRTEAKIFSLAHFPERRLIAAGNMEGGVHWISLEAGEALKNTRHHERGVFAIAPLGKGAALSSGGLGRLTRWDLEDLRPTETLRLSHTSLRGISIQGERIAVGGSDQAIHFLNIALEWQHSIEEAHDNSVFAVHWHPAADGRLVSGGRDARMNVWNSHYQRTLRQNAHWFTINDIKFRPDGAIFATASRDKTIRLWAADDFRLLKELNGPRDGGHLNSVNCLLWLDNDTLVSASDDRSIIIWGGG